MLFNQEKIDIDDIRNLSILELMKIKIVTAAKNPEDLLDIPASVAVITAADIKKYGYRSYLEILNHTTGFYMINDYHYLGHKNFGVRGFFSPGSFGNVIILVNGVPQLSDEYMDYPDTKITVPVEAIDRIEIIRGPMSVMYGNGAFFGAINIITNQDSEKNSLTVGGGNYGENHGTIHFSGKTGEIEMRLNAGYSKNTGIDVKYSDLTSNHDIIEYSRNDINATTKNMLESGKKYVDMSFKKRAIFGLFSFNESFTEVLDGIPSIGQGSEITHIAANMNLGFDKKINSNLTIKGLAGYYTHSHRLDYERIIVHAGDMDAKLSRALDFDITANYTNEKYKILFGGYVRSVEELLQIADFPLDGLNRADGEIMIPRNERILTKSLYHQTTWKVTHKIDLMGGFRIEHLSPYTISYNRGLATLDTTANLPPENRTNITGRVKPPGDGYALTPRFSLLYKINPKTVIKLMVGSAIKQPTFMDNLRQIIMQRPFLNVQKIQTYEMNITSILRQNCRTNFSIFYNKLYDLITATNEFSPESGWTIFSANSGKLTTIGTEICTQIQIHPKLNSKFSISYQKTVNDKAGFETYKPGYSPDLLAFLFLDYEINETLTISMKGKYISEIKTEWVTDTSPEAGTRLGEAIPACLTLDGNLMISNLLQSKFNLALGMKNGLDREIRYPTTASNTWIEKGYLDFGRQVYINLTYDF